ncbi:HupE/UreJ family protein [Alterisphingorhabdus coralli]|uniref:HupE/UreJ family protein n=1 Tax=Alterisphingorhabdus coralli TaxID=3071408 RepID=A0AA97FAM9_9SPHN|nr:HupE/UreJ family protein [Parasphingorhabdus sp. SCSIO 66989]WOE76656.1 HupE/UreJ family protein [Parasphingorhabdus sp. SCSIO 66989]
MIRLLIGLVAILAALPVSAHELRPSVVELREIEAGEYTLEWKVTLAIGSAAILADRLEPVIPENCTMQGDPVQNIQSAALMGRVNLVCEGAPAGENFGLSELLGKSDAIARFIPQDAPTQSFRLTADAPSATILAEPSPLSVLFDYFIIGAEHIVFGWDHLLFVIALVLLVRTPWPVVKAATAFTIAHSITLVATILGYSGLPSRPVEALIALSIVFLAVEVAMVLRDPEKRTLTRNYPWAVAFIFGLVHGFGFAGALADIGLPQTQLATALFAFNVGVEAGQLLVVAITLLILAALRRAPETAQSRTLKLATYAIGTTGSFWLIERLIG